MATASSAQREPSMEEILASIRRIIEDSDSGRPQPRQPEDMRQDLGSPSSADEPAAANVDAFRAELRAGEPEARQPATLADVQAQLAAEGIMRSDVLRPTQDWRPEVVSTPAQPAPAQPAPAHPASAQTAPARSAADLADEAAKASERVDAIVTSWKRDIAADESRAADAKAAQEASTVEADRPAAAARPAPEAEIPDVDISEDDLAAAPEARAAEVSARETETAEPKAAGAAVAAPAAKPAILSEHVERQVAAAFGELSDAFAQRSRKTFDEMAEEMLRPMLQDWLDNNLPTLVERLVREEIERVARGAQ